MIRTAAAFFSAALILATAVSAQAPPQAPLNVPPGAATITRTTIGADGTTNTVTIVQLPSCPVSMQAKQGGMSVMLKTGQKPPEPQEYQLVPKPSQHIHLILKGYEKDKSVASAIVTARGLSARGRIDRSLDASRPNDPRPNGLRRTMTVAFAPDQDGSVTGDLDLPAFTSVSSIQLESITYSDGSTWKLGYKNQCSTSPDPVMLIAAQ